MIRLYLRRSTEHQEHSLDTQRTGAQRFVSSAKLKGAIAEYVDDDRAGDDFTRPALLRLIAETSPGDIILTRDQSRLGREVLQTAALISTLRKKGARVIYYADGREAKADTAMDKAVNALAGLGAELELENIRSRTREALRARVRAARVAGGRCYGYRNARQPDGRVVGVVDEAQAEVVRRIFNLFIEGGGYKLIAHRLNAEGIPGPRAGGWRSGQVRDILRNERYRGIYIHGRVDRLRLGDKRKAIKVDESKWIRVEIPEWKIVDDITWQRAHEIIQARAPQVKSTNRQVAPLAGVGRCARCGGALGVVKTKVSAGTRVRAYGCITRHTKGATACQVATRRPADLVDRAVAEALTLAAQNPAVVDAVMEAVRAEIEDSITAAAAVDIAGLEREIVEVKKQHRNLIRIAATLDEPDPEVDAEIRTRSRRVAEIQRALASATRVPVEAAAQVAQAQAAVKAKLATLGTVLEADPAVAKSLYRDLFPEGLSVRVEGQRPARFVIEGAAVLAGKTSGDPTGAATSARLGS